MNHVVEDIDIQDIRTSFLCPHGRTPTVLLIDTVEGYGTQVDLSYRINAN